MTAPDALFQELILQHYRHSRNRGRLDSPSAAATRINPTCGDEVTLHLAVEDGIVRTARISGQGCAISQASASMMAQRLEEKNTEERRALVDLFTRLMHGDPTAATDRALGDLRALVGVAKFPARVRCALLAWDALAEAENRLASASESFSGSPESSSESIP
jgi:nitrogen fixation NifU-like protein